MLQQGKQMKKLETISLSQILFERQPDGSISVHKHNTDCDLSKITKYKFLNVDVVKEKKEHMSLAEKPDYFLKEEIKRIDISAVCVVEE